jgi:hypothetical protein
LKESGYFDSVVELKPLIHTWSLAVEEQYYILFPVFLLLTWKLGLKWVLSLLAIVFVISLGVAHWGAYNKPSAAFYLLPTRGWELLIGVFAAFYLKYNSHLKSNTINQILSVLGFGMILYAIVAFDESTPFPSLYALIPTIGTVLLVLSAVPNTLVHKLLSFSPIVGVGLISYSTYLWHQPILAFARHKLLGEISDLLLIILCLSSFVTAYISWRFVEKPFRDKRRISRKSIFSCSLIGIIFFVLGGMSIHWKDGFYERFNENQRNIVNTAKRSPLREECNKPSDEGCSYFGGNIEWATFGDSHMIELSYALAEMLREKNKGLIQHTFYSSTGCRPVYDENAKDHCGQWSYKTLNSLKGKKEIKNVMVSYRIGYALFGEHAGIYPKFPNEIGVEEREKRWKDLITILEELIHYDKNVFLILQAPELPIEIRTIVFNSKDGYEGVSRKWWEQRMSYVTRRLDMVPSEVIIIDPKDIFCDEDYCYAVKNNKALYFDDDHLSVYGSKEVLKLMASYIK